MRAMVNLTDTAAERLRLLAERGDGKVVRLTVRTSGCAGLKYDLGYADGPVAGDELVEQDGAKLHIDPKALMYILGTTIGWVEERFDQRFTFDNPNEIGRCGCGESFSAACAA